MVAINPYNGTSRIFSSMPEYWDVVIPDSINYLKPINGDHLLAIALRAGDAGNIAYVDNRGVTVVQAMTAGSIIPGLFARVLVTGTTCTKIYAGFVGG